MNQVKARDSKISACKHTVKEYSCPSQVWINMTNSDSSRSKSSDLLIISLQEDSGIRLSQTNLPPQQLHQCFVLHLTERQKHTTHTQHIETHNSTLRVLVFG